MRTNPDFSITSIYFGGGSPSLFTVSSINLIMEFINKKFYVNNRCESTLEMNPEDVSREKLHGLKKAGINRLSIGVQSFNDKELNFLEREHGTVQSKFAVESVLESGFQNINLDFIIGLPGQDRNSLEENFETALKYNASHISTYILEGVKDKNRQIPDEGEQASTYNLSVEVLNSLGYVQYEVSNFCKNGQRSVHNMKYWTGKKYIGAGISASGFDGKTDYRNYSDLNSYYTAIDKGLLPIKKREIIDPVTRKIITGLRLTRGIDANTLLHKKEEVNLLLSENILIKEGRNISVSPSKLSVLNEVLLHLI